MINEILFYEFFLYFLALAIGFNLHKRDKDSNNKRYFRYKPALTILITSIMTFSTAIFLQIMFVTKIGLALLVLNILFFVYFFSNVFHQTRCWKQHRMIVYNFLLLPSIYYASLVLGNLSLNLLVILILIYSILEFQFAKFKFTQMLIWD